LDYKLESNSKAAPSIETAGGPSNSSPLVSPVELGKTPAALVEVNSDDDVSYTLSHVKIPDQEFVRFFDDYLAKLDDSQRASFSGSRDTLKTMKRGYEMHVMKFGKKLGSIDGMLCVNIDHTREREFGAYIRHFSMVDRTQFEVGLQMALEYIWTNLYADNIRIDLYHFKEDGKMGTDTQLKAALIQERRGFKWKSLIN
jgi:hypothetical protein